MSRISPRDMDTNDLAFYERGLQAKEAAALKAQQEGFGAVSDKIRAMEYPGDE